MKKNRIFYPISIALLLAILFVSGGCAKENSPAGTGNIEFVSLIVEKDSLAITELTKVTATVTGDNLTYTWKCDNELGVFEGSGAEVLFTICHGGKFKITCEVNDSANHQAVKDAYVTYVE